MQERQISSRCERYTLLLGLSFDGAKKPKDTNNVPVNRVGNSKKQKQRKRRKQPTARERNAAEAAKMQVEGFVTFWHDGKWHRVAK